ncbi:DUF6602 domain-containing protein [Rossellomorea sp. GAMAL-10_SWC]
MTSKIFDEVLDRHINFFIEDFCYRSIELFKPSEKDKFFHSGEFGVYREQIVRSFLKKLIPTNLEIGTGFIINDKSEVSTQCDVIVFDKVNTPLQDDVPFYPIETVVAIGEVKSNLDTTGLKEALKKLAKNKELRENVSAPSVLRRGSHINAPEILQKYIFRMADIINNEFDTTIENEFWKLPLPKYGSFVNVPNLNETLKAINEFIDKKGFSEEALNQLHLIVKKIERICQVNSISEYNIEHNHCDHITSFLVCDKIDLKMDGKMVDLPKIINKWYDELDIKAEHRHNMILSLRDGIFLYFDPLDIERMAPSFRAYPKIWNEPLVNMFFPCFDPFIHLTEIIDTVIGNEKKRSKSKLRDIVDVRKSIGKNVAEKINEVFSEDIKKSDIDLVVNIIDNIIERNVKDPKLENDEERVILSSELYNFTNKLFQGLMPKYKTQEHIRIFGHYIWLNSIDTTVLHTETAMYMTKINVKDLVFHM